jgi:hypothetical protein
MKYVLTGTVAALALVLTAPAWAQNPGPTSAGTAAPPPAANAPPPAANSAEPPMHHAVRHARAMHAHHRHMAAKAALTGDTTAQLNREELARIQSGNLGSPPAPSPNPGTAGPPPSPSGGMGGPPPH